MKYLSVASGIEAATQAWHPLGWKPWAFSQFDPEHKGKGPDFASAVLKVHYPDVPNLGDMTKFEEWPDADVDVLVGGTPCQSYSVAGLRAGLDDPRGDLMLTYVAIARRYRPSWVVWENVPGVLSDDGGRSFGTLLGLLTGKIVEVPAGGWETAGFVEGYKSAYGVAWRVLDSQFVRVDGFGRAVPQRRRRVFVVGYLGDWRRAAAVLFERSSMSGDSAPRRQQGQGVAGTISASLERCSADNAERGGLVAKPILSGGHSNNPLDENLVAFSFKASHFTRDKDGAPSDVFPPLSADADKGDQDPLVCAPIAFDCKAGGATSFAVGEIPGSLRGEGHGGGHTAMAFQPRFARNDRGAPQEEVAYPLTAEAGRTGKGDSAQCVAFSVSENSNGFAWTGDVSPTLQSRQQSPNSNQFDGVLAAWAVRRLTPTECERLQGMADGYTNIPWRGKNGAPDGPRYKVLGNSMSVNVMRWIGTRIEMVNNIAK